MKFVSNLTPVKTLRDKFFQCWDWVIKIITGDLVTWLLQREHFGEWRFRIIRFIYQHLPFYPKARNEIWTWVLNYLPSLGMTFYRGLAVLDVGCTDSLLPFELEDRGYLVFGIDVRPYQCKLSKYMYFLRHDVSDPTLPQRLQMQFNYIICISVIELVGVGMYGDKDDPQADRKVMENLHKLLRPNGYLLMTLCIQNFKCLKGRGYHPKHLMELIKGLFIITELTQRSGHLCVALIKQ